MGNDNNSVMGFIFYYFGVLPPVWVSIVFTPFFVLVVVVIIYPGRSATVDNGVVLFS